MNLSEAFGITEKGINWRYPFAIGVALIFPQVVYISFMLIVGKLILGVNSGIFSNELLNNSILKILGNIILIICLVLFLYNHKKNSTVFIGISAILSRLPELMAGHQIVYVVINIISIVILFVFYQYLLNRFKNPMTGLVIAFLIYILTGLILGNMIYVIHVYNHFGKTAIIYNIENGEALKKLGIDLFTGLLLTFFFIIGLWLSCKLFINHDKDNVVSLP